MFSDNWRTTFSGYRDWHGGALSVVGGIGFLFLVATGGIRPVPIWRTIFVAVVGTAAIVIVLLYATRMWHHFPLREFGGLLAILSATGLLLLACLELRQYLEKRAKK